MSTYSEKLRDPRWQRKRLEIMERDEFKCRDCDREDVPLAIHHCHYQTGNPWDTDSELLMTLCEECHADRQKIEDEARYFLGRLFAKIGFPNSATLSASLSNAIIDGVEDPKVYGEYSVEWPQYQFRESALTIPSLRPIYTLITGHNPDWEAMRQNQEIEEEVTF